MKKTTKWTMAALLLASLTAPLAAQEVRRALFGDLHVHTRYSFDAFIFGTRSTPDDAYRFAKGEAIDHPAGFKIQLDRPLDFYAVTDHANYLGMLEAMSQPDHPLSKLDRAKEFTEARTIAEKRAAFRSGAYIIENLDRETLESAWQRVVDAAERHNEPGKLTTFIAYEYTSPAGGNLHRNVIFRNNEVPNYAFSRVDSLNPEDLWDWMDEQRAKGYEAMAIPHNANASSGRMFALETFDGDPLTLEWIQQRRRNEPLVEITQVKGTSDTHPFLSPNDEWADFEIFPYRIASWIKSTPKGSYVRDAYLRGLALEEKFGENPYDFGIVAASDTHNGGGSFDEENFFSKVGTLDATGQLRGSVAVPSELEVDVFYETYYRFWGASGLAGVWAEENTRESIWQALSRRETFGTSGPRMRVRMFAGFGLPADLAERADAMSWLEDNATAMGAKLEAQSSGSPELFVWATKDPRGVSLQRVQVIKGWLEDGEAREQVYDVACSDGGSIDPQTHRCEDNGAAVDVSDCSVNDVGDSELVTVWQDPDFDPAESAFYYVRVLENPTCRWSTWDAIQAGTTPRPDLPLTIQERAWSSPVWIQPRR